MTHRCLLLEMYNLCIFQSASLDDVTQNNIILAVWARLTNMMLSYWLPHPLGQWSGDQNWRLAGFLDLGEKSLLFYQTKPYGLEPAHHSSSCLQIIIWTCILSETPDYTWLSLVIILCTAKSKLLLKCFKF